MSDFQEGTNPAPVDPRAQLDRAYDEVVNDPSLSQDEQNRAIDAIAARESELANQGKLPGTEATVTTGSEGREVFIRKDGTVTGSKAEALGEDKVI